MKTIIAILIFLVINSLYAQDLDSSKLTGYYLGQKEPGIKAEIFSTGLVSVGEGVHGNIVFTPDYSEAAWHPNYMVNGKALIYIMKNKNWKWEPPTEFFPKGGYNCSEPFYSSDGNKLYYLFGKMGASGSGNAENETFYFVERKVEGWSEPKLLDTIFSSIKTHWQFSLDKNGNLYFGGSSPDKKGEIYFSKFENEKYLSPQRLPETINTVTGEFSPCISPDNSYLVFTRMLEQKNGPPQTNLFISFRGKDDQWKESQNLTVKIGSPAQSPIVMMSQARITPDSKYLFFCYFNGKGHMVYWVSTNIIEELRPKE